MKIEILKINQIDLYIEHLGRHFREYGIGGVIAHPFPVDQDWDSADLKPKLTKRWQNLSGKKKIADIHSDWEIVWGLFDNEKICGHLDLKGSDKRFLKHRCMLGMGIETKFRSQGYGKELVTHALKWTKEQVCLEWIDLNVFAENAAAVKLYRSFGFIEAGRVQDRLRVSGQKIEDLHFVLNLKLKP